LVIFGGDGIHLFTINTFLAVIYQSFTGNSMNMNIDYNFNEISLFEQTPKLSHDDVERGLNEELALDQKRIDNYTVEGNNKITINDSTLSLTQFVKVNLSDWWKNNKRLYTTKKININYHHLDTDKRIQLRTSLLNCIKFQQPTLCTLLMCNCDVIQEFLRGYTLVNDLIFQWKYIDYHDGTYTFTVFLPYTKGKPYLPIGFYTAK